MLNLLTDPWLPVIRRQTGRCIIRPAQIAELQEYDPVMTIDWPRPDFRISTLEFLIGLLDTAFHPDNSDVWNGFWCNPPDPVDLDAAFARFVHAFNLDGNGPRFLQDMEDLQSGAEPIERLLIEAPGQSTNDKNTDLMVHRERVASLGRAAAAIALYTFQSWAPAGGAGNRTGLRGGGPLVTIVVPGATPTLWQTIWANVPVYGKAPTLDELPLIFPWLAPTVTSEDAAVVTPQSAHPMQCWWGMPRRIQLDFVTHALPRPCEMTGEMDSVQVVSWRQRPRGANYVTWGRQHPLTPHYQQKPKPEWLPVHPQPGGIGYNHWLGLILRSTDGTRLPAATVATWHEDGRGLDADVRRARLIAAGYDMDKMKARGFVENEMPLPSAGSKTEQDNLDDLAKRLVEAANQVASLLRFAVRNALFSSSATIKLDASLLNTMGERLWQETEARFFEILEIAAQGEAPEAVRVDWKNYLRAVALGLFDETAPLSADSGGSAAARISKARKLLGIALAGYGTSGVSLFNTLLLPAVESKDAKKQRTAA